MISISMVPSGMLPKQLKEQGHLKHLKNKQKNVILGVLISHSPQHPKMSEQQDNPYPNGLAAFSDKGLMSCVVITPYTEMG